MSVFGALEPSHDVINVDSRLCGSMRSASAESTGSQRGARLSRDSNGSRMSQSSTSSLKQEDRQLVKSIDRVKHRLPAAMRVSSRDKHSRRQRHSGSKAQL